MSDEPDRPILKSRVKRAVEALARLTISTAIVIVLAALGLWNWAILVLGLCILGEVSTFGMVMRRLVEERDYALRVGR